jgi:tRNA (mo5U34)-methyltransferase
LLVSKVPFWWHNIDLGDGVITPGTKGGEKNAEIEMWNKLGLPEDMSGKTVVDVGCADGYFSFECEKKGAKVTALDTPFTNCEQGFYAARAALGSKVDYIQRDICFPGITLKADIVLFLGVLYHVRYPLLALENIYRMTKDFAIIETHYLIGETSPIMKFCPKPNEKDHFMWYPSLNCVRELLKEAGFKHGKVLDMEGDRLIICAYVNEQ